MHEPRQTVAERLAGTRPLTIKRKSFPDASEGYGEGDARKVAAGRRSGISLNPFAGLFTSREKVVPVKRSIKSTAELQAAHKGPKVR